MFAAGHASVALSFALVLALVAPSSGCEKKSGAARSEGQALFASTCARCHGADGAGGLPLFAGGPAPRNFRERAFHASHTDEQIKLTIVNGKGTGMPPFARTFTDTQLDALVAHVRGFDPERSGK